ncbi:uncharacterized protein LOC142172779 [Nicotiana tabacum]|uniref:Uncharacterized protein LOC142172779 n=1 Tax=Nicotiana tabacum TaxID=4097 RepID=A0AC58T5S7_TOBAC
MVQLEAEKVEPEEEKWKCALIAYIIGETPGYNAMSRYVSQNWLNIEASDVYLHEEGYYVIRFHSITDMHTVFYAGPYTISYICHEKDKQKLQQIPQPKIKRNTKAVTQEWRCKGPTKALSTGGDQAESSGEGKQQDQQYNEQKSTPPANRVEERPEKSRAKALEWCKVNLLKAEAQIIHCEAISKVGDLNCCLTIVYGFNTIEHRKSLWDNLRGAAVGINKPWLVVEDFNAIMFQDDRLFGNPITYTEIKDYSECAHEWLLTKIQWGGDYYTWYNKLPGSDRIYSRLDSAFGNHEWMMACGHLIMKYDVPFISAHAPMLLTLASSSSNIRVPFKFFNVWANHEEFLKIVEEIWHQSYTTIKMKNIWVKMKCLRPVLKRLNNEEFKFINQKIEKARQELAITQEQIHMKTLIKERTQRKQITELTSLSNKRLSEPKKIKEKIVNFYKGLMRYAAHTLPTVNKITMRKGLTISHQQRIRLCAEVTEHEIYEGLSSIGNDKSQGVDGYNAYFFKKVWSIVKSEVVEAIEDFFKTGKLYKKINCTTITLIPKTNNPNSVKEYRLIAYFTILYKMIAKILDFRLQGVMLAELGFLEQFITWVMEYVQTVNYTMMINGEPSEPFNAARGLRQGDPMSPFLFAIATEYLSRKLNELKEDRSF